MLYTAGYSTVPPAVQEAAALWVAEQFWMSKRDPALVTESTVGVVGSTWPRPDLGLPPRAVTRLLAPYRAYRL